MADTEQDGDNIQVDSTSERDSALGDDLDDYAQSLTPSVVEYKWRHGRRYHTFGEADECWSARALTLNPSLTSPLPTYPLPNDEQEQNRLDILHHSLKLALSGRLFLAPLSLPDSALRVLDVGTGTGIWAMEFGDAYPDCNVLGNDLSPIQPQWVPANVEFEVDDVTAEWPPRPPFDYIHSRYMAGSIQDWPRYMQQCYDNLRPGGWVEFQDYDIKHFSQDNSIPEGNHVLAIHDLVIEACEKVGRSVRAGKDLRRWAEQAGFTHVQEHIFRIPLGPWAKDPRLKEIGVFHQLQLLEGMEGFTFELFTKVLGWSIEEVQLFLIGVRRDIKDRSVHMMTNFHVVYGQHPSVARQPLDDEDVQEEDIPENS